MHLALTPYRTEVLGTITGRSSPFHQWHRLQRTRGRLISSGAGLLEALWHASIVLHHCIHEWKQIRCTHAQVYTNTHTYLLHLKFSFSCFLHGAKQEEAENKETQEAEEEKGEDNQSNGPRFQNRSTCMYGRRKNNVAMSKCTARTLIHPTLLYHAPPTVPIPVIIYHNDCVYR